MINFDHYIKDRQPIFGTSPIVTHDRIGETTMVTVFWKSRLNPDLSRIEVGVGENLKAAKQAVAQLVDIQLVAEETETAKSWLALDFDIEKTAFDWFFSEKTKPKNVFTPDVSECNACGKCTETGYTLDSLTGEEVQLCLDCQIKNLDKIC
jgi:hypothetical protein